MALWQLLKGSGYGGYGSLDQEITRDEVGILDPIECAGKARILEMRRSAQRLGIPFAVEFLNVICDFEIFRQKLKKPIEERKLRYTNCKYRDQLQALCDFNITKKATAETVLYCSSYFSVPKQGIYDRAIFNGKCLSDLFDTPPTMNIPDIPRLIEEVNAECGDRGASFVSGDFRHWFHQLPLEEKLQRYFGLAYRETDGKIAVTTCLLWTTLPMGWSWSPAIAQAAAWTVLAHVEDNQHKYIRLKGLRQPPMFTKLYNRQGCAVGFVTVYIDNYLVVSRCPVTAQGMSDRIIANCAKTCFNVEVKEHKLWSRSSLILHEEVENDSRDVAPKPKSAQNGNFHFLGIEMGFRLKTLRGGIQLFHLQWRVQEKVGLEKKTCPLRSSSNYNPKRVASVVGRILYHRLVSLLPLGTYTSTQKVLNLLRRVGIEAWKTSWSNGVIRISEEERASLELEWSYVHSGQWNDRSTAPKKYARVVTDACDDGYAYVILDDQGKAVLSSGQLAFPTKLDLGDGRTHDLQTSHIYLKELYAAVEGIKAAQAFETGANQIQIMTDNTAVGGSLRRRYSSNHIGMCILGSMTIELRVICIPSECNVADAPSRGSAIIDTIRRFSHEAYLLDEKGERIGVAKRHPNVDKSRNGMRHVEGDDDDIFLDEVHAHDVPEDAN